MHLSSTSMITVPIRSIFAKSMLCRSYTVGSRYTTIKQQKTLTHFLTDYSDQSGKTGLIFVNLIDNKKEQGRLGRVFKEVVDGVQAKIHQQILKYVWFDFHHETKQSGKWNNLSKLVSQVDKEFRAQGFFCRLSNGAVISQQSGVVRTNCMDNLDRTNVVQSLFARRSLLMQLGKMHLLEGIS